MIYSCWFWSWALCFLVIGVWSLEFFLIWRCFYAEYTVIKSVKFLFNMSNKHSCIFGNAFSAWNCEDLGCSIIPLVLRIFLNVSFKNFGIVATVKRVSILIKSYKICSISYKDLPSLSSPETTEEIFCWSLFVSANSFAGLRVA